MNIPKQEDCEEQIVVEDEGMNTRTYKIDARKHKVEDNVAPKDNDGAPLSGRRIGRPRKENASTPTASHSLVLPQESGRRRSSARGVLPIDNEDEQYYPCPFDDCPIQGKTRLERNFHLRTDHPGYTYKEGDGASKILQRPAKKTPATASTSQSTLRQSKSTVSSQDLPEPLNSVSERDQKPSMEEIDMEKWHDDCDVEEVLSELDESNDDMYEEMAQKYTQRISKQNRAGPSGQQERDAEHEQEHLMPRKRGRPKLPPGSEPAPNSKIRISDPSGKYRCYVPECDWRGGYRSIRADHMKWCHKDWRLPPRYILQRISRDGVYVDPDTFEPEYSCLVEGCEWKGNFRASRSTHMRSVHPEYQSLRKKAPAGGFTADGKYECHDPSCAWRGSSRSTRAAHMKREHPGFVNPIYTQRNLPCCDCNVQCASHKTFVDHMVCEHRIGGLVQREFTDVRDYEEWFDAVQDSFSVEFIKRMGIKQTETYQVLYLYCSRGGGYRPKRLRTGHPFVSEYAKRRSIPRAYTKCGRNCAAFLRVVHWADGRLTVVGCVEHTGHRMGTALLRLSPSEREVMDEYLYVHEEETPLEFMIDRLRDMEGCQVDGYDVIHRSVDDLSVYIRDEASELASLNLLVSIPELFPPGSTFNVNLVNADGTVASDGFTLGLMTKEMQDLWKNHSHRAACIEEVRLMISTWDVSLTFVLVFDETDTPRCACVYISQQADKNPLLKHLREVHDGAIETLVTDCSADWPMLIEQHFGDTSYSSDIQIAEWHLLPEWANQIDQLVTNRVDRFAILCTLRRWIRATEPTLFEGMVIDLFEALREMELDELAQALDAQLTIPDYAKRWTPLNRNPLTEHNNPTLEIACRVFRERFLNCELCSRLDEYVGLLLHRVYEFNNCQISGVYSTAPIEPPRQVPQMYEDIDPANVMADGTLAVPADLLMRTEEDMLREEEEEDMNIKRIKMERVDEVMHEEIVMEEEVIEEHVIEGTEAEQLVAASLDDMRPIPSVATQSSSGGSGESDSVRKQRINVMMQRLKEKMDMLADDESMELVESSLSQVVEQLDHSSASVPLLPPMHRVHPPMDLPMPITGDSMEQLPSAVDHHIHMHGHDGM